MCLSLESCVYFQTNSPDCFLCLWDFNYDASVLTSHTLYDGESLGTFVKSGIENFVFGMNSKIINNYAQAYFKKKFYVALFYLILRRSILLLS